VVAILTRAEPVAALYKQRKMHHVGPYGEMFKILEDQVTFVPGVARHGKT
jgi:phage terminase large subunit-like protein